MTYVGSRPANKAVQTTDIEDDAITSAKIAAGVVVASDIADDSITLAKMASGTDGNIISYDASGNPVAIATGNDGQVLTSTGAGSPPAFESITSNATHSGEVTGSGALTIADNIVDEANLKVSNSPTNGQMLTAQSGNTGGLTWAAAPTSTWVDCGSLAITSDTEVFLVDGSGGVTLDNTYDVYYMSLAGFDTGQRDSDYIRMTFSADGGSNYNIECHKIGVKSRINNTGTANASTAVYSSQAGPTQIIFPDTAPEQNTNTAFGEFWFYNFGNTSKYKTCFFRTSWWSASEYLETITGTLYIESTSAIDAIRLAADHGTMRTGNLRLYGLSN